VNVPSVASPQSPQLDRAARRPGDVHGPARRRGCRRRTRTRRWPPTRSSAFCLSIA
jgi:hypothetical protein